MPPTVSVRPEFPDSSVVSGAALQLRAGELREEALNFHLEVLLSAVRFADGLQGLGLTEAAERASKRAATGYLKFSELLAASPSPMSESVRIKAEMLRSLLPELAPEPVAGTDHVGSLTTREKQVLKLIAEGHSSKELAFQLGISFKTAVCHRYNIMEKLQIHDVSSLVRFALRTGIAKA